jgi:hypothetical protein
VRAGLEVEGEALAFQQRVLLGVLVFEPRPVEVVPGLLEVLQADDLFVPGRLGAPQFALGGPYRDARHVGRLLVAKFPGLLLDALAGQVGHQALQGRPLLVEQIGETGAVDPGDHLVLRDGVAGLDHQRDGPLCRRVDRGLDRRDDPTPDGHVAHKFSERHLGQSEPFQRDGSLGRHEALRGREHRRREGRQSRDDNARDPEPAPLRGLVVDDAILSGRVADSDVNRARPVRLWRWIGHVFPACHLLYRCETSVERRIVSLLGVTPAPVGRFERGPSGRRRRAGGACSQRRQTLT